MILTCTFLFSVFTQNYCKYLLNGKVCSLSEKSDIMRGDGGREIKKKTDNFIRLNKSSELSKCILFRIIRKCNFKQKYFVINLHVEFL